MESPADTKDTTISWRQKTSWRTWEFLPAIASLRHFDPLGREQMGLAFWFFSTLLKLLLYHRLLGLPGTTLSLALGPCSSLGLRTVGRVEQVWSAPIHTYQAQAGQFPFSDSFDFHCCIRSCHHSPTSSDTGR